MGDNGNVSLGLRRIDDAIVKPEIDRASVAFDAIGDLHSLCIADPRILSPLLVHLGCRGVAVPDRLASVGSEARRLSGAVLAHPFYGHVRLEGSEIVVPNANDLLKGPVGSVLVKLKINRVQKNVTATRKDESISIHAFRKKRLALK